MSVGTLVVFLISPGTVFPASVNLPAVERKNAGVDKGALLSQKNKFKIPAEFGSVEESFRGTNGKTIIYIQDAHDSLEAQENIAKMIHYLVAHDGVKTVFEEGYEGPVPTDQYFGKIKDPNIKEKVAYFLMDKLRIGGAEYAHITRFGSVTRRSSLVASKKEITLRATRDERHDFQLIGADSLILHKKNIKKYQESAQHQQETEKDLASMSVALRKLAQRHFTKDLKAWMGLRERLDHREIELLDYLRRTQTLFLKGIDYEKFGAKYPTILLLLSAEKTRDGKLLGQLKNAINAKTLFEEINQLEDDYARAHLKKASDRKIFYYYKLIQLLKRLGAIEVTAEEYQAVKQNLKEMNTAKIARFLVNQSRKSVVLSKTWETHLQSAVGFYETAEKRDGALGRSLGSWAAGRDGHQGVLTQDSQPKTHDPAVLVYGGFHKEAIKTILRRNGFSYVIVSPKITAISVKHQNYYKQLMRMGYDSIALPTLVAKATRAPDLLEFAAGGPKSEVRVNGLIDEITEIVGAVRGRDLPEMDLMWNQHQANLQVLPSRRSEMRNNQFGEMKISGWLSEQFPLTTVSAESLSAITAVLNNAAKSRNEKERELIPLLRVAGFKQPQPTAQKLTKAFKQEDQKLKSIPLYVVYGRHVQVALDGFDFAKPLFDEAIKNAPDKEGHPNAIAIIENAHSNISALYINQMIQHQNTVMADWWEHRADRSSGYQIIETALKEYEHNPAFQRETDVNFQSYINHQGMGLVHRTGDLWRAIKDPGAFTTAEFDYLMRKNVPQAVFEPQTFTRSAKGYLISAIDHQMSDVLLQGNDQKLLEYFLKGNLLLQKLRDERDRALNTFLAKLMVEDPQRVVLHFRGINHQQNHELIVGAERQARGVLAGRSVGGEVPELKGENWAELSLALRKQVLISFVNEKLDSFWAPGDFETIKAYLDFRDYLAESLRKLLESILTPGELDEWFHDFIIEVSKQAADDPGQLKSALLGALELRGIYRSEVRAQILTTHGQAFDEIWERYAVSYPADEDPRVWAVEPGEEEEFARRYRTFTLRELGAEFRKMLTEKPSPFDKSTQHYAEETLDDVDLLRLFIDGLSAERYLALQHHVNMSIRGVPHFRKEIEKSLSAAERLQPFLTGLLRHKAFIRELLLRWTDMNDLSGGSGSSNASPQSTGTPIATPLKEAAAKGNDSAIAAIFEIIKQKLMPIDKREYGEDALRPMLRATKPQYFKSLIEFRMRLKRVDFEGYEKLLRSESTTAEEIKFYAMVLRSTFLGRRTLLFETSALDNDPDMETYLTGLLDKKIKDNDTEPIVFRFTALGGGASGERYLSEFQQILRYINLYLSKTSDDPKIKAATAQKLHLTFNFYDLRPYILSSSDDTYQKLARMYPWLQSAEYSFEIINFFIPGLMDGWADESTHLLIARNLSDSHMDYFYGQVSRAMVNRGLLIVDDVTSERIKGQQDDPQSQSAVKDFVIQPHRDERSRYRTEASYSYRIFQRIDRSESNRSEVRSTDGKIPSNQEPTLLLSSAQALELLGHAPVLTHREEGEYLARSFRKDATYRGLREPRVVDDILQEKAVVAKGMKELHWGSLFTAFDFAFDDGGGYRDGVSVVLEYTIDPQHGYGLMASGATGVGENSTPRSVSIEHITRAWLTSRVSGGYKIVEVVFPGMPSSGADSDQNRETRSEVRKFFQKSMTGAEAILVQGQERLVSSRSLMKQPLPRPVVFSVEPGQLTKEEWQQFRLEVTGWSFHHAGKILVYVPDGTTHSDRRVEQLKNGGVQVYEGSQLVQLPANAGYYHFSSLKDTKPAWDRLKGPQAEKLKEKLGRGETKQYWGFSRGALGVALLEELNEGPLPGVVRVGIGYKQDVEDRYASESLSSLMAAYEITLTSA